MIETAEALLKRREEIIAKLEWLNVRSNATDRLNSELRDINRTIDRLSRSLEARESTVKPP